MTDAGFIDTCTFIFLTLEYSAQRSRGRHMTVGNFSCSQ